MSNNGKKNIFRKIPIWFFRTFTVFSILALTVTGVSAIIQAFDNDRINTKSARNAGYNLFVDSVAQDTNLLPSESAAAVLFDDLKTFVESDKSSNPFSPISLQDINIPVDRYSGLNEQIGCVVKNGNDSCTDAGKLTEDFILMLNTLDNPELASSFYREVFPIDNNIYVYPFNLSWYYSYGILYLLLSLLFHILYLVFITNYYEYKKLTTKDVPKLKGILSVPLLYIVAVFKDIAQRRSVYRTEQEQKRADQDRINNHPLAGELYATQEKLVRLEELLKLYPNDKQILGAASACRQVIKELETFPDKLSQKSAQYLAQQTKNGLSATRDIINTRLEALDEVHNL